MDKQGYVYVLQLADDCWYVGWSQDIQTRICAHFLHAGSKWTMLHRPIAVHSIKPGCCLLETLTTLALMAQHGWEKVRGGSYCNVEMTKPPAALAKAMHYASYKSPPKEHESTSTGPRPSTTDSIATSSDSH